MKQEKSKKNTRMLSDFKMFELQTLKKIIGGTSGDGPIDPPIKPSGGDRPR